MGLRGVLNIYNQFSILYKQMHQKMNKHNEICKHTGVLRSLIQNVTLLLIKSLSHSCFIHILPNLLMSQNQTFFYQYLFKMGNSEIDNNLKCGVVTQVHSNPDGQVIHGTVYIQALKPIEQGKLMLDIIGEERVSWIEVWRDHNRSHHTLEYSGSRILVKFSTLLHDFGTNINKGMYQIQFSFMLPSNLPPSSTYEGEDESKAQIAYSIVARFSHPKGSKVLRYIFPIKLNPKNRLVINPNPVMANMNRQIECCCLTRGKIRGQIMLDKGAYAIGDTLQLNMKLDQIESQIDSININLQKKIIMNGKLEQGMAFGFLFNGPPEQKSITFVQSLQTYKLPGISPLSQQKLISHQIRLAHSNRISSTYNGSILTILYQLQIIFDAGTCSSATTYIPIYLTNPNYIPQYIQCPVIQVPPYWNPQSYPAAEFGMLPVYQDPGMQPPPGERTTQTMLNR